MTERELLQAAKEARKKSYCPYSGFAVGAALLAEDGRVFCGCNVENASYGVACCAERTALFSAVAAGVRRFSAIAIVGEKVGNTPDKPCPPCGACRQALSEFCTGELPVYFCEGEGVKQTTLGELLPMNFSPEQL